MANTLENLVTLKLRSQLPLCVHYRELIENEPEAAKFLFSSDPKETFSWLNTAMAKDALLITCPENRTIQKPIHLLNDMTGKEG